MIIPIILSGGSGTRLWPLSRKAMPKQFRSLTGTNTLIQDTASRLTSLSNVDGPLVVCGAAHVDRVIDQLGAVGAVPSILIEPAAKNTAPAVASACLAAVERDPKAIVVVLPSDHVIGDVAEFARMVRLATTTAGQGYLTTFGVIPTYPATGYGYIQPGEPIANGASRIAAFVEKPDVKTATRYLEGGFLWNAGIFVFGAADFLTELEIHAPALYELVTTAYEKSTLTGNTRLLDSDSWNAIEPLSVDYAVMEPTTRGAVLPLSCGWSDIGSWATLHDLGNADEDGNVIGGQVYLSNVKNSYVRSESKPVVVLGVHDLIIVETDDSVLVMHRDSAEDIKTVTERLPDDLK
ncbi:MAG: mannose-1-phosphate guanylyltransferase/mannose-6-phosphate isomerase [Acidimicrobiia bacterium]|nr:mannose-1-phosphate guanylyltransferase/mannose-6-phosphate isomerase [Acidimicrobiia bacterium]